jgi:hypothetical protein
LASWGTPFFTVAIPRIDDHVIVWRLGGERVFGQPHENPRAALGPHVFFERDEFWFNHAADGL